MTELSGEQFQTSPELGFGFGRIPIGTVIHCLHAPEVRDDPEADEAGYALETIRSYFEQGSQLSFWSAYVDAVKARRNIKGSRELPLAVFEKYTEIADMIYEAHAQRVEEEKQAINQFIGMYPGVIAGDPEGILKVASIDTQHNTLSEAQVCYGESPVREFVTWSDETQTQLSELTCVYVDMTAFPEKFSKYLHQYRVLNDIAL